MNYPEKYWKLANHYYTHNKAVISGKNVEKVQKQHPALTDDFYNLGQIESVNIVAQSDEIYN